MYRSILLILILLPLFSVAQVETPCYNNANPNDPENPDVGLITHEDIGCLMGDVSALQSDTQGFLNYGYSNTLTDGTSVVDDFTLSEETFLSSVSLYAINDTPDLEPNIEAVRIRIWNGNPTLPESEVIYGTLTENRLLSAEFSGIYRSNARELQACTRPIMEIIAEINTLLPAGDYWLEWQFDVPDLTSNYRTPPITILGQSDTGNAVESTDGGDTYSPITDQGNDATPGLPFIINCTLDIPVNNDSPGMNPPEDTAIPTMGEWGLISLFLLLLIVGTVQMKEPYTVKQKLDSVRG